MKKKNQTIIWTLSILIIIGALIALLIREGKKPGAYDTLAQCIADSGAKFYGAWWCSHCQAQKALFGKSVKLLPYVECQTPDSKQTKQCTDIGIKGYPTWIFADGTQLTGEVPLAELATKTNCEVPVQ